MYRKNVPVSGFDATVHNTVELGPRIGVGGPLHPLAGGEQHYVGFLEGAVGHPTAAAVGLLNNNNIIFFADISSYLP